MLGKRFIEQLFLEVSQMEKARRKTVAAGQGAVLSPLVCPAGNRSSVHSLAGLQVTWPHAHP